MFQKAPLGIARLMPDFLYRPGVSFQRAECGVLLVAYAVNVELCRRRAATGLSSRRDNARCATALTSRRSAQSRRCRPAATVSAPLAGVMPSRRSTVRLE